MIKPRLRTLKNHDQQYPSEIGILFSNTFYMGFSFFSIKNKWFLGYSLAILVLGGRLLWFQIRPSNLPVLVDWAVQDVGFAIQLTEKIGWRSNQEINKYTDAYKHPINEGLRQQAKMLDSLAARLWNFDISKSRNEADVSQFLTDLENLLNPISAIVEEDSVARTAFLTVFPEKTLGSEWQELAQMMQGAHYNPALLTFQSIIWRANIAKYHALTALEKRTWQSDQFRFDSIFPIISADLTNFEKTGKIDGDIFLTTYSSTANNLIFKVDGNEVPNEKGIGTWSNAYQMSGRRKIEVQCIVKNPLTGELRNYSKEFGLIINP